MGCDILVSISMFGGAVMRAVYQSERGEAIKI
jgi:hypothetical protein